MENNIFPLISIFFPPFHDSIFISLISIKSLHSRFVVVGRKWTNMVIFFFLLCSALLESFLCLYALCFRWEVCCFGCTVNLHIFPLTYSLRYGSRCERVRKLTVKITHSICALSFFFLSRPRYSFALNCLLFMSCRKGLLRLWWWMGFSEWKKSVIIVRKGSGNL